MDVAGSTEFIGGCGYDRFVAKKNYQAGNQYSQKEHPSHQFSPFPSHNQAG
jgi:hypothetical protein